MNEKPPERLFIFMPRGKCESGRLKSEGLMRGVPPAPVSRFWRGEKYACSLKPRSVSKWDDRIIFAHDLIKFLDISLKCEVA